MIGDEHASTLAERFGTPLYVYELDEIGARCAELRAVLPAGARLFYSLKANPLPSVAAAALGAGMGVEASSEGELAVAIDAGFDPADAIVTGPAKSVALLEAAVEWGAGCFSAESWRDLVRIDTAAARYGATARAILRLNAAEAPAAGLAMTGVSSQFGFDLHELARSAPRLSALTSTEVVGFHTYAGTQVPDAGALATTLRAGVALATLYADRIPPHVVDLGGGFPWPFATDAPPPDLTPLRQTLAGLGDALPGAELWFESGRYVSASAGSLVARVADVKRSRGTTYVVLDAGIAHLGGMAGLGRVLRPAASLVPVGPARPGDPLVVDVVGPLCTPLDRLASRAELPPLEPGDLVRVPNTGAYGATASLSGFLSHPPAVEVSLSGGEVVDVARLRSGHEAVAVPAEVGHGD